MADKNASKKLAAIHFAEALANDYRFDKDCRNKYRSMYVKTFLEEIGHAIHRSTRFETMESLRSDLTRVLAWDSKRPTEWRKAEGYGSKGKDGPKRPTPDIEDLAMYASIERLWPQVEAAHCHLVALGRLLQHLAGFIHQAQSGPGEPAIRHHEKLTLPHVACLRFAFSHPQLIQRNLVPTRDFLAHVSDQVGVHLYPKTDRVMITELRSLAGVWYEPWTLMGLSLGYPWISWGYHAKERRYE